MIYIYIQIPQMMEVPMKLLNIIFSKSRMGIAGQVWVTNYLGFNAFNCMKFWVSVSHVRPWFKNQWANNINANAHSPSQTGITYIILEMAEL